MEDEKERVNDAPKASRRTPSFFKKICGVDFAEGELVPVDFIVRHWKSVVFIVFILFLYIGNRYSCNSKMTEIRKLRAEIAVLKIESTTLSSELSGLGQPSQIKQMLEKKGIDIRPAVTPSYKLIRKEYGER